jgi:hypothetical protein
MCFQSLLQFTVDDSKRTILDGLILIQNGVGGALNLLLVPVSPSINLKADCEETRQSREQAPIESSSCVQAQGLTGNLQARQLLRPKSTTKFAMEIGRVSDSAPFEFVRKCFKTLWRHDSTAWPWRSPRSRGTRPCRTGCRRSGVADDPRAGEARARWVRQCYG